MERSVTGYRRLFLPLSVVALLFTLHILGAYGLVLPPSDSIQLISEQIRSGSLLLIAALSFVEGVALINAYFPGGGVILFAMASTAGDLRRAFLTFIAIVVGSALAHQLNYWAGRAIVRKSPNADSIDVVAAPTLFEAFASYWHPHSGSLYSLRSGSDGVAYKQFSFRFAIAFGMWNIFWGVLMYLLGHVPASSSDLMILFYLYLGWWIVQELRATLETRRDLHRPA
jgi:membrane protein DedA with SNARE-associated domain